MNTNFYKHKFYAAAMFLVLSFLLLSTFLLRGSAFSRKSNVYFSCNELDFGSVAEGSVATRTVSLLNQSSQTISWKGVITSCGCTKADVPKETHPNSSTPVSVTYNALNRSGTTHQTLYFCSDAIAQPVALPIRVNVIKTVSVSPSVLSFQKSGDVDVERLDHKDLQVKLSNVPEDLQASLLQVSKYIVRIHVSVKQKASLGAHEGFIQTALNCPGLATRSIPVLWHVPGIYKLLPDVCNFGQVANGAHLSQIIVISGQDVSHLRVASCPQHVLAHVIRTSTKDAALSIEWQATNEGSPVLHTHIALDTGNSRQSRIVVPLFAVVTPTKPGGCTSELPCTAHNLQ